MLLYVGYSERCEDSILLCCAEWRVLRQYVVSPTYEHIPLRILACLTSLAVYYKVTGPGNEPGKERVILEGEKERQGDFVFTATSGGEYRFCFDNSVSTFSDKLVDFEISVSRSHCSADTTATSSCLTVPIRSKTNNLGLAYHKRLAPLQNNSAVSKRRCSNSLAKYRP